MTEKHTSMRKTTLQAKMTNTTTKLVLEKQISRVPVSSGPGTITTSGTWTKRTGGSLTPGETTLETPTTMLRRNRTTSMTRSTRESTETEPLNTLEYSQEMTRTNTFINGLGKMVLGKDIRQRVLSRWTSRLGSMNGMPLTVLTS